MRYYLKQMSRLFSIIILLLVDLTECIAQELSILKHRTICNPINLDYRFCMDTPSRREAADPTVVLFKNEYYLFASKCGGYYRSTNLIDWELIVTDDLELHIEDYAPTVVAINDTLYFLSSSSNPKVFKSSDPKGGHWEIVNENFKIPMTDPALFLDDDGRLYFYYGCSDVEPIRGVELDIATFDPIGEPIDLINSHREKYGWERGGDFNEKNNRPWIEGAWMTKHNDKYYLQYACPGTEFKSYCDAVYISHNPLGPFQIARHNPFSYKPGGFISGAGHGSTFKDRYGNYWHIASMSISQKHPFERRLGLFPVFFDCDGEMYACTKFGDFPYFIPQQKIDNFEKLQSGWMLLSYKKEVEVSSALPGKEAIYAVDEEIRSYWSAKTGNKGEWIMVDLKDNCCINALQINFAEEDAQIIGKMIGRGDNIFYQYLLEYSKDKVNWSILVDKRENKIDAPHDYIELPRGIDARYIRLTNYKVPDGTFAIFDLRIFGRNSTAYSLQAPRDVIAKRDSLDRCRICLKWTGCKDAVGYNISYGAEKDKLYNHFQVMGKSELCIGSLNSNLDYYFMIEAFNENKDTATSDIIKCSVF